MGNDAYGGIFHPPWLFLVLGAVREDLGAQQERQVQQHGSAASDHVGLARVVMRTLWRFCGHLEDERTHFGIGSCVRSIDGCDVGATTSEKKPEKGRCDPPRKAEGVLEPQDAVTEALLHEVTKLGGRGRPADVARHLVAVTLELVLLLEWVSDQKTHLGGAQAPRGLVQVELMRLIDDHSPRCFQAGPFAPIGEPREELEVPAGRADHEDGPAQLLDQPLRLQGGVNELVHVLVAKGEVGHGDADEIEGIKWAVQEPREVVLHELLSLGVRFPRFLEKKADQGLEQVIRPCEGGQGKVDVVAATGLQVLLEHVHTLIVQASDDGRVVLREVHRS